MENRDLFAATDRRPDKDIKTAHEDIQSSIVGALASAEIGQSDYKSLMSKIAQGLDCLIVYNDAFVTLQAENAVKPFAPEHP